MAIYRQFKSQLIKQVQNVISIISSILPSGKYRVTTDGKYRVTTDGKYRVRV